MELHENKPNPVEFSATKVVQAYGLRKCPKLVEQLSGEDLRLRVNVLAVLCEEFHNPYVIQGCAQAGVVRVLSSLVSDPDYVTRERSSKALSLMAEDANGISAILTEEETVVVEILNGIKDPSEVVRSNIYDCIYHITRTRRGIDACVIAGVATSFAEVAKREVDSLKPKVLQSLHNIASSSDGMIQALNASSVETCIGLLNDNSLGTETKSFAAKALGLLCFDEEAKFSALENHAVPTLVKLCGIDSGMTIPVKINATLALMAITSTDEGKRQLNDPNTIKILSTLIYEDNRSIRLHVVKLLSNAAVFPPIRPLLLEDAPFMNFLKRISIPGGSGDPLLEKHALLALNAVNWVP